MQRNCLGSLLHISLLMVEWMHVASILHAGLPLCCKDYLKLGSGTWDRMQEGQGHNLEMFLQNNGQECKIAMLGLQFTGKTLEEAPIQA